MLGLTLNQKDDSCYLFLTSSLYFRSQICQSLCSIAWFLCSHFVEILPKSTVGKEDE